MASLLSWLDYSSTDRDEIDRLLDAFRDKGTIDELGIGTIRDTFSEALFPGTSTLHTRARYLLFVPWAITQTTAHRHPGDRAGRELRAVEVRLIEALRRGDPTGGIIGRFAGESLKSMPSVVYWSAIARYRIKRCPHSIEQHLRYAAQQTAHVRDEDDDATLPQLDPCFRQLPKPPPDWLDRATFALTRTEAEFLREQIIATCGDRYLAWLLQHGIPGDPATPWHRSLRATLPQHVRRTLEQARLFSLFVEGAAILYNLLLARQKGWAHGIEDYTERLARWQHRADVRAAPEQWDNDAFWALLAREHWRSRATTRSFVEAWVHHVGTHRPLATNPEAHQLIERRERQLKGSRSRFVNADALEAWEGGSGMGRLTFRWAETKILVGDIHRGLAAADA